MAKRCDKFNNVIKNNGLIDLGFSGPIYTWGRGTSWATRKSARLDRSLCNAAWRTRFQEGAVRHLPHSHSDHCPLLISPTGFGGLHPKPKPFRFQAAWLEHCKFEEFLHQKWQPQQPLVSSLAALTKELCCWNREVFGNLFRRKRKTWARLEGIQRCLSNGGPLHLLKLEMRLRTELNTVLQEIETLWFQKSRVAAIRDGDRNTKYFHISTIIRRRANRIEALQQEDGHWISSAEEIKHLVVDYFATLFTEPLASPRIDLPSGLFPRLPETTLTELSKPYSSTEILRALRSMAPFKAPGPDGFPALFFRRYWNLVGPSTCELVLGVLNGRHLPEGLNDTFLVLLPKVDHPHKINQFRPIGLCNVAYKLVTKVLVHRLQKILPNLISPSQSSFVPGRQISDNIVIMQEALHSMRRKRGSRGFMAIKLDLEKAYDRLNWQFIRDTLLEMRLPQLMVEVIMMCLTSCSMRILWNGEPTSCFHPSRGIRQGDPLSAYLFVACMERLSQLIEGMVRSGQWNPLQVGRNSPQTSSLFFADDVVLFAEATATQARLI